ncbi:hypothetical protein AVEN_110228-1 [Araneus ventricosus]|uniref:Uncharacterized protein n=1 Tax=Araneus ventricosus TaxID=182803 RepID=A0A4Y2G215_ARAVE|nr:hypothetical protein AVEN_110228-1 [Araneus ventricosus]
MERPPRDPESESDHCIWMISASKCSKKCLLEVWVCKVRSSDPSNLNDQCSSKCQVYRYTGGQNQVITASVSHCIQQDAQNSTRFMGSHRDPRSSESYVWMISASVAREPGLLSFNSFADNGPQKWEMSNNLRSSRPP